MLQFVSNGLFVTPSAFSLSSVSGGNSPSLGSSWVTAVADSSRNLELRESQAGESRLSRSDGHLHFGIAGRLGRAEPRASVHPLISWAGDVACVMGDAGMGAQHLQTPR